MSTFPAPAGFIIQPAPASRPDRVGPHGRAWRCAHPDDSLYPAAVETWLLHVPRAHPYWAFWMIGAITLDPERGVDRRALQFAEATYEFLIVAMDPQKPIPQPTRWENAAYMDPVDLKYQVELPSGPRGDGAARSIVVLMVRTVIESAMSPDACNRAYWLKSITATVNDVREGRR
jgi:hypothetical protein